MHRHRIFNGGRNVGRFLISLTSSFIFIFGASAAHAVCTKPSGAYTGYGSGSVYSTTGLVDVLSILGTLRVRSDGVWEITMRGKGVNSTVQTSSATVPAIGNRQNKFDMATCSGEFVTSQGFKFLYNVSDSGAEIRTMGVSLTAYGSDLINIYRRQ